MNPLQIIWKRTNTPSPGFWTLVHLILFLFLNLFPHYIGHEGFKLRFQSNYFRWKNSQTRNAYFIRHWTFTEYSTGSKWYWVDGMLPCCKMAYSWLSMSHGLVVKAEDSWPRVESSTPGRRQNTRWMLCWLFHLE